MSGSGPDKFRNILAVFFLLVIALGLFYVLERQKKLNLERVAAVPESKHSVAASPKTSVDKPSPKSEEADEEDDQEESAETAVEHKAPAAFCKPDAETKIVKMSHERFMSLLDSGQVWVPVTVAESCYHEGKSVVVIERRAEDGFVYETLRRGTAKVAAIEAKPSKDLQNEKKYLLTKHELKQIKRGLKRRRKLTGEKKEELKVKMLLLKSEKWFQVRKNYGAPLTHPAARTLTLNDFKTALGRGEIAYDVRPADAFEAGTIKGASNLPVNIFDFNQFDVQPPSRLKELRFRIDLKAIRHMKKKPLIIFSSCAGDFLSYNAVTYLRHKGFRKVRWFRGGFESWKTDGSGGCGTPRTVAGLRRIGAGEMAKHLTDRTLILHVVSDRNSSKYKIKNSTDFSYEEKYLPDLMSAFRPVTWDEAQFKASGDVADLSELSVDPDTPAIVYGRNEYDWSALKVALMLRAKGIKSVSWYRTGIDDWINHAFFHREDYPTQPDYVRN